MYNIRNRKYLLVPRIEPGFTNRPASIIFSIGTELTQTLYTGCPRRNVKYFGRVFLMLNYTDITQNTYIQS